MIREIEQNYKLNLLSNTFFAKYFMVMVITIIIVTFFLPYWTYFILYLIFFIVIYTIILKHMKIKINVLQFFRVRENMSIFNIYKMEKRKILIANILKNHSSFNKKDIEYLINYYKEKRRKKYNIDWLSIILSIVSPLILSDRASRLSINSIAIYNFSVLIVIALLLYSFYFLFFKAFSKKDEAYIMYQNIENILVDLYFIARK